MPNGIDQLQETLRQQLVTLFRTHATPEAAGAPGAAGVDPDALAFEPIGVPLPPSGFTLNDEAATLSPDLAMETLTALADAVPDVGDGEYRRTMRSISAAYGETLSALALPGQTPQAISSIERNQADAREVYEQVKRQALTTGLDVRLVSAMPIKWYDPAAEVWTHFASAATAAPAPAPAAPAPAAPPRKSPWGWKVLPAAERTRLRTELMKRPELVPVEAPAAPVAMHAARVSPLLRRGLAAHAIGAHLAGAPTPAGAAQPAPAARALDGAALHRVLAIRPDLILRDAQKPTPVEAKPASLVITFEACVVSIGRPWMHWPWVDTRGWYLPGLRSGQLCLEDQPLHRLPISAILVRNLKLTANGAVTDELKDAVSFGPFQFVGQQVEVANNGATFDVSVECLTPQLVAWVTQPLTGLPPKSDPTVPET